MINYVSSAGKVSSAKQPRRVKANEFGVTQDGDSATKLIKECKEEKRRVAE